MNFNNLNKWLTLVANLGVLAGIIVVAVELQQTQMALKGEASSMRAQMATDLQVHIIDNDIWEVRGKLEAGEELTPAEAARGSAFLVSTLRHFENMHYQNQIGILDDEIWQSNLRGLGEICNSSLFKALRPEWNNGVGAQAYIE